MSKQFTEFRVGDIVEFSKGKRVTSVDQLPGNIPYVTAATESNGIDAWISNPVFTDKNLVTVNFFGKCFYHPYSVAFKDGTYGMKFKDGIQATGRRYLYFMTALEKVSLEKGSYAQMLTDDLAAELYIQLPITDVSANTDTPEPDWEYMDNYIKTIEQKFIDQVAGVNTREQEILAQLYPDTVDTEPEAYGFEEMRVGDLFKITPTSYYKSTPPFASDLTPQVTNTTQPNGISSFEPHAPNNEKNVITFSDTTVGGDTLFYQPVDFLGYSHIQKMTPTETALTKRKAMYIITAFKKAVNGRYDYGTKFNRDNAAQTFIQLPITPTGDIDWDYMEKYIAWIETQERESRKLRAAREEQILDWLHQQH